MRVLLFILVWLLVFMAEGQEAKPFSIEELREDFSVFEGSLEDFHPGLYWYRDQAEMNRIFRMTEAELKKPKTEREFFRVLSTALSKVGCGHTALSLSERTSEKEMSAFLPMELHFLDDKAYYIRSYGEQLETIQPGSEIVSINGIPIDSIYHASIGMLSGDGFSETGKLNMLNSHFWYTYAELFEAPKQYEITFLDAGGHPQHMTVPAMPKEEIYGHYFKNSESAEAKRNIVLTTNGKLAILKIKAFFGWKEDKKRIKVERKFKEVFTQLAAEGITQLIIDLRENGGGRVPWVLYSYFVNEPFIFARNADLIYSKASPQNAYQILHPAMKWIKRKWYHTWVPGSSKMSKIDSTRYQMTSLFMTKPYQSKRPQFKGEVYILTNGGTFSAASDFAAMMKSSGFATIIGEESGGGYYGNTSMEKSYVTLPHSKLRLEIPLVRHELNVDPGKNEFGRGVMPDHEVLPSIEDVVQVVDRQMEWTLEFVKRQ